MRIAVIGAGFTGLAAAVELVKKGHDVEIYEKDSLPGGLAVGFSHAGWNWSLEKHYHHLFTSDQAIRKLAAFVGHPIIFTRPNTSTWVSTGIFPLDSPQGLLKFKILPVIDRLRTGLVLAFLKFNPFWKIFESVAAEKFIKSSMGENSWRVLWEPLMVHKFGNYSKIISASWFWARIFKRSASLGYPEGGFQKLAESVAKYIVDHKGKLYFETTVKSISSELEIVTESGKRQKYDKIICTLPSAQFLNIVSELPFDYVNKMNSLTGIGAVNLVLSIKHGLLPNKIYWLNVNISNAPFLSVVEHTNFISSLHYADEHLVYIGNYLSPDHKYFTLSANQLLSKYLPYLKNINPEFKSDWVKTSWIWKTKFAQPIIPINYSKYIPSLKTPIRNLFLANIQQVYPWDRGTNYAVELGLKAATLCLKN